MVGFPLKPGFPLTQVYVITQWFLGQIGSNVWQIFYMYDTFTKYVGKDPCDMLLKLSWENMPVGIGGCGRKYIHIQGLGGLWVAIIIAFTWYLKS